MSRKNINFDDKKVLKSDFYKNKKAFQIGNSDVQKIWVSKKEPYGTKNAFKYFIGYNDSDVIRPLCSRLPQMIGDAKRFVQIVTMSFRVNNKPFLKHNTIWEKVEKLLKIDFESKPVYGNDDKYMKTKTKIYAGSVITNVYNKEMPKEKAPCKCLSIIVLDSVNKANKKYYPQTFLDECKYAQEKVKTENYIDNDFKKSESDSDSNDKTESDIDNDEHDK